MQYVFYVLLMLLMFGIMIFIHEFGHFFTARLCGVSIKEFSVGMGPRLLSWKSKKYETQYGLRLLPIGGFVSMVGEDEESDDQNAFCNKSVWKRMIIVLTGPVMNLIFGFLLMAIMVFSMGNLASTTVADFAEDATSNIQLQVGDEITHVNGTRVHTGNELVYEIMNQAHEPIDIRVIRNGEAQTLTDVAFPTTVESGITFGSFDFYVAKEETTPLTLLKHSFWRSVSTVKMVGDSLVGLLSGRFGMESISGPVGVVEAVETAADSGAWNVFYLVIVLSINLGVFNLIPFPALDGGRFLFLAIEGVRRKPLNRNVESYVNFVGIMILFALMIFVTVKDVLHLFG